MRLSWVFLVTCLINSTWSEEVWLIQDFEQALAVDKWPSDKPGSVALSREWHSSGKQSLKIDAGLMATFSSFQTNNWQGYDILRIHFNNTGETAATIGFEMSDRHNGFRERHRSGFGVVAGISTVDVDISGALWRGEENKPYLGKIKTPLDLKLVKRISFINKSKADVFVDQIELIKVKKMVLAGAYAFDFGRSKTQVMSQMLGVTESDGYNVKRGYGLVGGKVSMLGNSMSFPTPMLGDGLGLTTGSFDVNLKKGAYIGLVAFERGGFWGDEYSAYSEARLKVNKNLAHKHGFTPDGIDFLFQDTEIKQLDELAEKIIWPAHAIHEFEFTAKDGRNSFTLETDDATGYPLRLAGLILAPDTKQGRAYLRHYSDAQKKAITSVYTAGDKSRRNNRRAPRAPIVVEELPVGEMMFPGDYPLNAQGTSIAPKQAVAGQTLTIHLGIYAQKDTEIEISGDAKARIQAQISHGRYMPMRNYGVGSVWLEVNHYRPGAQCDVGPDLSRSVILEYRIPTDFGNGTIKDRITIAAGSKTITLPVEIAVSKVALEAIPSPVGIFMNALPIPEKQMDSSTWWSLQENLLREQISAGLTVVSGGQSLGYTFTNTDPVTIRGDRAIKYIKLAQSIGPIQAVVGYGGFFSRTKTKHPHPKAFAAAIRALEKKEQLPMHYVNSFDEPRSGTNQLNEVLSYLGPHTKAGVRTIGWTSWGHSDSSVELGKNAYAVALNIHKKEDIKTIIDMGAEPWVYNNGLNRMGMGLHLWRGMKLGMKGRMEWIGLFTQGFAFNNLDGREPSKSCFMVHREFGTLKTPNWLGVREGLLDMRIRLTLERLAQADDPVLQLWSTDAYRLDQEQWNNQRLEETRQSMLARILALSK